MKDELIDVAIKKLVTVVKKGNQKMIGVKRECSRPLYDQNFYYFSPTNSHQTNETKRNITKG